MTTTIQIEDQTMKILKMYKEQTKAKTYDEVIKKMMTRNLGKYAKKYRGILGKKDMEYVMKDLRDKRDRY